MRYLIGGLGIALLLVLGLWWATDAQLERARAELLLAQANVQVTGDANDTLRTTLTTCTAINRHNQQQRDQALQRAADAAVRAADLQTRLAAIRTDVEKTDDECRTLDAPLPAGFVDQLCIAGAANCRSH